MGTARRALCAAGPFSGGLRAGQLGAGIEKLGCNPSCTGRPSDGLGTPVAGS
jgi:hypothetical protein